ncbi:uncharacterized protein LOC117760570 [Lates japonicus]|uniref:Uncharacterized protein n=1 Tax=Lates japonicus TaxID=270547 RepID=A0AAD3MAH6_LATJO|nr:uncharacterized protein AKAME5_002773500 [Lates japonicus]
MTTRTVCFVPLWLRSWTIVGFGQLLFLLLVGAVIVGSSGESGPRRGTDPRSSDQLSPLQHSFTTVLPMQIQYDTNLTENNVHRRRSSASADSADSVVPPNILTASHLSALRDLVSDKKITVHLGLRVTLSGPIELLDQVLSLNKEAGIYSTGGKEGLFSMRVVGVKKATSAP